MHHYAILDLSPIPEGGSARDALSNTVALAQAADGQGYHRFWLAEHHNIAGIASSATAVLIGRVAAATARIRVGSGGIMLPNHAPLMVAEQFGTLETLFPGRIDLGLGRAPGTDGATARALRRYFDSADQFPQDVVELLGYLGGPDAGAAVRAIPGEGTRVPVWILGSSLFGAGLAAHLGLPYGFASHFAPAALERALATYRRDFRPSPWLAQPYAMIAAGVFAAETDDEAHFLRSSQLQAFAGIITGRRGPLPRPTHDLDAVIPPQVRAQVDQALSVSATGGPETLHRQLTALIDRYQPDELMITAAIHDPAARLRSFEIADGVLGALRRTTP